MSTASVTCGCRPTQSIFEDTAQRVAVTVCDFTRPHLFDFYEGVLALPEEHERLAAIAGYILAKKLATIFQPTSPGGREVSAEADIKRHHADFRTIENPWVGSFEGHLEGRGDTSMDG